MIKIKFCNQIWTYSLCGLLAMGMTSQVFADVPAVVQTENNTLSPVNWIGGDYFGYSLCLDANRIIVGALTTDDPAFARSARVYNFDFLTEKWDVSNPIILPRNGDENNASQHGAAVSILGDIAVVGAPMEDNAGTDDGSIFVYTLASGAVSNTEEIEGNSGEQFGYSLSQTSNLIAVGAPRNSISTTEEGAVYIYEKVGAVWSDPPKVLDGSTVPDLSTYDLFGSSVSLFTDHNGTNWLAVGAPSIYFGGSVWIFEQDSQGDWVQVFHSVNVHENDSDFGFSVSFTETYDDTLPVPAWTLWLFASDPWHDDGGCELGGSGINSVDEGSVEVYYRSGTTWPLHDVLLAPDCLTEAQFGYSLDTSGDHVAIGSTNSFSCDSLIGLTHGAGYVANYNVASNQWTVDNKLFASSVPSSGGQLGNSISIDGDMIALGGPAYDSGGKVLTYTLLNESLDCDPGPLEDAYQLCGGDAAVLDCNNNSILDSCEIFNDPNLDCNGNDVLDECELASNTVSDCNDNGIPDGCDLINDPDLYDCNGNGVLDACEWTYGLHIIFMIDGSSSVGSADFTTQRNTLHNELCTLETYLGINPLIVTVIQIGNSPDTNVLGPVLFQHGVVNQICIDILALEKDEGGTNVFGALIEAETQFLGEASTLAREIVLMGDGNANNWTTAQIQGNVLRSMTPPVRICTAKIPTGSQPGPCTSLDYQELANVIPGDPDLPIDPGQPLGTFVCLELDVEEPIEDNYVLYTELCIECLTEWGGTNDCDGNDLLDSCEIASDPSLDCNGNGVLNSCTSCTADLFVDGVVNVTDLLLVIGNWGPCPTSGFCYGDTDCSGAVDVGDLLEVINQWGYCGGATISMPQSIQDCLNRYPLGSQQLERCIEYVEFIIQNGN